MEDLLFVIRKVGYGEKGSGKGKEWEERNTGDYLDCVLSLWGPFFFVRRSHV